MLQTAKITKQVLSASSTKHPKLSALQIIQIALATHGVFASFAYQIVSFVTINTTDALGVVTVFWV